MPDKYLRYAPPVFITLILVVGHFSFGILESYKAIAMVIHLQLKHRKTAAASQA